MISIYTKGKNIVADINNSQSFTSVLAILKQNKCIWSPSDKLWKIPVSKYEVVLDELQNIDTVSGFVSEEEVRNLLAGTPQQKISETRVKFNYDILNYPPLVGKHPFEDFQKIDLQAGISRNRYAFFIGMGGGKSWTASGLIAHYYLHGPVGKVVLITSTIGVNNLYHEVLKFVKDFPKSRIKIVDKTNRNCFNDDADVLVMNYITFRLVCNFYKESSAKKPRKPWLPIGEWAEGKPAMLLLDESHLAANPSSLQGNYLQVNSELFEYVYLFTGTPADTPEKLYNQFRILDKWLVHNLPYTEWLGVYASTGNRFSASAINEWKYDKLEELNKVFTSRYGVYRKTEDILVLPEHYIKKIRVPMSPKQRAIYEEVVVGAMSNLQDFLPNSIVQNSFPYAMLALENPYLLIKHKEKFSESTWKRIESFSMEKDYEKFSYLDEIVKEIHPGEKGVIWCIHPNTVELIAKRYEKLNPVFIHGGVDKKLRPGLIEQFNKDPKVKLIIAVVSTLNTSVSLTEASWWAYVERPANFTEYDQSQYRVYRNGQKKNVSSYELMYERSLDMLRDADLAAKGAITSGLASKNFISQEKWKEIFNYDKDSDEKFEF